MSLVGYNTLPGSTRVRTPNGLVRLDELSGSGPTGPPVNKAFKAQQGPPVSKAFKALKVTPVNKGSKAQQVTLE